jgi:hypothetical protein
MDEEEYSPQRRRGKRGFVKAFPLRVSAVNSKFFFAKNLRGPDNFCFGKTQIGARFGLRYMTEPRGRNENQ